MDIRPLPPSFIAYFDKILSSGCCRYFFSGERGNGQGSYPAHARLRSHDIKPELKGIQQ